MLAFAATTAPAAAVAQDGKAACRAEDFYKVVDEAGAALRKLKAENGPMFQSRLRELKAARGWGEDEFLDKARVFVEDRQISAYNDMAASMLAKINSLSGSDAGDEAPDCVLLTEMKGHLARLVETMNVKWQYMFDKVEAALAE